MILTMLREHQHTIDGYRMPSRRTIKIPPRAKTSHKGWGRCYNAALVVAKNANTILTASQFMSRSFWKSSKYRALCTVTLPMRLMKDQCQSAFSSDRLSHYRRRARSHMTQEAAEKVRSPYRLQVIENDVGAHTSATTERRSDARTGSGLGTSSITREEGSPASLSQQGLRI